MASSWIFLFLQSVRDAGDVEETPRGDARPSCHYFEGIFSFFLYIYFHVPPFSSVHLIPLHLLLRLQRWPLRFDWLWGRRRRCRRPSSSSFPTFTLSHFTLLFCCHLKCPSNFGGPIFAALCVPPPPNFQGETVA